LVRAVDNWFATEGHERARCFIQYGTSGSPTFADARAYLPFDILQDLMDQAAVVVSHGGPATIMECRRRGRIPIVMPRRADLGEHVDDHQLDFCRRLATTDDVIICESAFELAGHLDRGIREPRALLTPPISERAPEAVHRFAELVDSLVAGSSQRRRSRAP
jgi:UDP-N-acetylglucosamine transferase subunit ALG13